MGSKVAAILTLAKSRPTAVRFSDLVKLVLAIGYVLRNRSGSHHVYKRPGLPMINLQPQGSMAKGYQVKQVLSIIQANKLEVS